MKKITLIIGVVMILMVRNTSAQTNIYHTFPDSAFWRVDLIVDFQMGGASQYYYYYFEGDTNINTTIYKKLMKSAVWEEYNTTWFWNDSLPKYMGALRDDSIANKAFLVLPTQNTDTLLFDYNLIVGDTLKGLLINCNNNIIINSTDSIFVGVNYRKRWNFNTCNNYSGYIIQGIGSMCGLIEKIEWTNSFYFPNTYLICVKDSNIIYYEETLWSSSSLIGCQLVTSTNNISPPLNRYNIYPNPTTSLLTLSLPNTYQKATINLYDMLGEKVLGELRIENGELRIDVSTLSQGIYFLEVLMDGEKVVRKVVKI